MFRRRRRRRCHRRRIRHHRCRWRGPERFLISFYYVSVVGRVALSWFVLFRRSPFPNLTATDASIPPPSPSLFLSLSFSLSLSPPRSLPTPYFGAQSLSVDVSSYFLPSSFLSHGRAFDPYPGIFWGALRRMNDWTWKRNGQSYSCSLSGAHLPRIQRVQFKKKRHGRGPDFVFSNRSD